jgi:hypothetical protein
MEECPVFVSVYQEAKYRMLRIVTLSARKYLSEVVSQR